MTQKYSNQEKKNLVNRYLSGETVSSIIAENKIPRSTFYDRIRNHKDVQQAKEAKTETINPSTFRLLQKKNERLEGMIEILKASNCTATAPLYEKLSALEILYIKFDNVHMICEALDVSRGTFYNHILRNKNDSTSYAKRREELRIQIQEVYDESNQIFGAGKIAVTLRNRGISVSNKMVLELMRDMGIVSIRQNSKSEYLKNRRKMPNVLKQNFRADAPNQTWVSDVTYFKVGAKAHYICVIIDLFSRMVVGYRISLKNSTQLTKSTFKQAYENRNPQENLIFHSDRGTNYRSASFCNHLKSLGVEQSFSKARVPYDNSVVESFFSSLKREELYRKDYNSENEFRKSVDNYMVFYNTKRPHRTIKNKTPEQCEVEYTHQINDPY